VQPGAIRAGAVQHGRMPRKPHDPVPLHPGGASLQAPAVLLAATLLVCAGAMLDGLVRRGGCAARHRARDDAALDEAIAAEERQRHLSEVNSGEFDLQG
jgi:hypothetical protein